MPPKPPPPPPSVESKVLAFATTADLPYPWPASIELTQQGAYVPVLQTQPFLLEESGDLLIECEVNAVFDQGSSPFNAAQFIADLDGDRDTDRSEFNSYPGTGKLAVKWTVIRRNVAAGTHIAGSFFTWNGPGTGTAKLSLYDSSVCTVKVTRI